MSEFTQTISNLRVDSRLKDKSARVPVVLESPLLGIGSLRTAGPPFFVIFLHPGNNRRHTSEYLGLKEQENGQIIFNSPPRAEAD